MFIKQLLLFQTLMNAQQKIIIVTRKLSVSTRLDLITVLANWDSKAMELTANVSKLLKEI